MANTTLGNLLIVLRAETSAFAKGMKDAKDLAFDSSADIVSSLGSIVKQLDRLKFDNAKQWKKDFEVTGGVVAGVGIAAATATIAVAKNVAEQGKEMSKLSQSYGLPIETVSQLRVASALTGVSLEQLTIGFGRMAKAAEQVAESGKKTGGAFAILKVDVTDATGKVRPMTSLISDVADRFSRMQDGTQKTALAMQLFGRAGAQLIPFLNEGRAGIAEFTKLSDELGLTWTEKDVKAGEQLARTVEILELRGTAFKEQFAKAVIPYLDQVANAFTKVDSTGRSAATALGQQMGSVLTFLAKRLNDIVTAAQLVALEWDSLSKISEAAASKPFWQRATGVAAFTAAHDLDNSKANAEQTAKYNAIMDRWYQVQEELNKPWTPPALSGKGGAPFVPGLGTAEDMTKLEHTVDELMNKVREALNAEGHDPLATEISNVEHLKQELEDFRALHPERIWGDINDAVNRLAAAEDQLKIKQAALIATAEIEGGPSKTLSSILSAPVSTPTVTGGVQQGADLLKLQQDAAARNQEGARIYSQTRDAAEQYVLELQKLNILLKDGNITQDTYNRALDDEKEKLLGVYDPAEKYRKELEQIDALHKQGVLVGQAYEAVLQKVTDALAKAQAQQKLSTGGSLAGAQVFFQQSQQNAPSLGQQTFSALNSSFSGMQNAMSTFFSQAAIGTRNLGKAFRDMGVSMVTSIVDACARMAAQWVMTHVVMAAISKLFSKSANADEAASGAAKNAGLAQSAAFLGAANAYAAYAEFPPVAAAMAAAALSVGTGFAASSLAAGMAGAIGGSAAGGTVVPADNLLYTLHQNELVLPSRFTAGLSNMIDFHASAPGAGWTGWRGMGTSVRGGDTYHYYGGDQHFHNVSDPREAARLAVQQMRTEFRTGGVIKR